MDILDIDTGIQIIDTYSKSGFNDEIELSVGNRSRVVVWNYIAAYLKPTQPPQAAHSIHTDMNDLNNSRKVSQQCHYTLPIANLSNI